VVQELQIGDTSVATQKFASFSLAPLIRKMKLSALLALDIVDGAIRSPLVGLSVQRDPHRKAAWHFAANDVEGAYGLTTGPMSDGLEALLSEIPVT
jgi:hypothetical protein